MIVAKSDRYLSKTDEDRFLHRAIRYHGAKNVFLVLNKADVSQRVHKGRHHTNTFSLVWRRLNPKYFAC
jgi:predicted GTPase